MSDPQKIKEIQEAVSIPVMAKCRIGHFVEAQILEALEVDYIDESEVLTPADVEHHVDKHAFTVPFVCGATNLGEALRRIAEGAAMIRTKGEAGHRRHRQRRHAHARRCSARSVRLQGLRDEELYAAAKEHPRTVRARPVGRRERPAAGRDLHCRRDRDTGGRGALHAARRRRRVRRLRDLQVGPRRGSRPGRVGRRRSRRAKAIVEATTHYADPKILAEVSSGLGTPMVGHLREHAPGGGAARSPRLVAAARSVDEPRSTLRPAMSRRPRIGVLALQGAFREHVADAPARSAPTSSRCASPLTWKASTGS